MYRLIVSIMLFVGFHFGASYYLATLEEQKVQASMSQMRDGPNTQKADHMMRNGVYFGGMLMVGFAVLLMWTSELKKMWKKLGLVALLLLVSNLTGCYRPFEPVKLEQIQPNEIGFLIPLVGTAKSQEVTENEEYYKSKLVMAKQVKIPQQWVPKGYEYLGANGVWEDAAMLIKVEMSPETREWTADENSGTSSKNEAIWVMTSDQVEFSTGWTVTARIKDQDSAMKFLHNYRNGSLAKIMDKEIRAKLQSTFTLAVTDLPMDTLKRAATPVIVKVSEDVTKFFDERGIQITNIGITGGFVYKDKSIQDTLVRVFNSEQEKNVAIALANAQEEKNRSVTLAATGKAQAIMTEKKAEADGIKMVAEARNFELTTAKADLETYVKLKSLELNRDMLIKWDGKYPQYFMYGGGQNLNTLLQLPDLSTKVEQVKE